MRLDAATGPGEDEPSQEPGMEAGERLIVLTLTLEEALAREDWEEADALFVARDLLLREIPPHAIPREIDAIDARILARLQRSQAEIRREILSLNAKGHAANVYNPPPTRQSLNAA